MASLTVDVTIERGLRGPLPHPVAASFSAGPGLLHVTGPSGVGKSTLLAAIAGLVPLARGRVALGDIVWSEPGRVVAPEERRVGWVPQSTALFPHLTAAENIEYGARSKERVRSLAEGLEIAHLLPRPSRTLSGGEAARVALARALATDPPVLLLDEPFASLDRALRERVRGFVANEIAQRSCIALLIEHEHERDAERDAERRVYELSS